MAETAQFIISSTDLLLAHCSKLQGYSSGITLAVANATDPGGFNAGHVLKEISRTAQACNTTIEFFGDENPVPQALLDVLAKTQHAISGTADALIFLIEMANRAPE